MAFTSEFIEDPTLFALAFPPPAAAFVVKLIESADPADMEARVQAALDEVEALNALIVAAFPENPEIQLTLNDADLAGAGDGHTFIVYLSFVADTLNGMNELQGFSDLTLLPQNIGFTFAMAGEVSALQGQIENAMVRATNGEDVQAVFQFLRGAAKGTRFMYGVGGLTGGNQQVGRTASFRAGLFAAKAKRDAEAAGG